MRHGSTAGNERHAYVGRRTDEPLSESGRTQARACSWLPALSRVYVSPMARARETASLCLPRAQQLSVAGLEEMDFGAFEGKRADELSDNAAYRAWVDGWCQGSCPGGESRDAFVKRTAKALAQLLLQAREAGEEELLVIAHGGTVMAALHAFAADLAKSDGYFEWQVGCCAGYVCELVWDGERLRIVKAEPRP